MNQKLIVILALLLCPAFVSADEPFPKNIGTIYDYSQDNIPEVCFFPVDKARWDGYDVTVDKWSLLTDYQKVIFLRESIEEINRNIDGDVHLTVDFEKFAHSVDDVMKQMAIKIPDPRIPIIRFVFDVLKENDMIQWRDNSKKVFKGLA